MNEYESDTQPKAAPEGDNAPVNQPSAEPAPTQAAQAPTQEAAAEKSKTGMYVAAAVTVAAILLGVMFLLEKEGRMSTGIFDSFLTNQDATTQQDATVVAVVNGTEITGADLQTSIQQFNQAAAAQGVDTSSPEVIADIRSQALDVLVNTALLKQAAQEQGVEVPAEATAERLATIEAEIGGAEALEARIVELGLTQADLEADIQEELVIQTLLNSLFAEAAIDVTDAEIQEIYDEASASGAEELPPLETVSEQIEAQVRGTKEQEVIEAYLETLKTEAEIEIN
jgi:hypothetical protein